MNTLGIKSGCTLLPVSTVASRSPPSACARIAARPAAPAGSSTKPSAIHRQPHRFQKLGIVDQNHFVDQALHSFRRLGNRDPYRNPICDGFRCRGGNHLACLPTLDHGGRAAGADSDNLRLGRVLLYPHCYPGDQRSIAHRQHDGINVCRLSAVQLQSFPLLH